MEPINVLSLFDGISCGQVALARAGIPVNQYFASEIDKHAIKVTQHNWPDTIQLGSVTDLKHIDWLNPKIDLLIGGSPCQGFSFAGKQLNFNDPRSALFFEYVRILNEIRDVNPDVKFLLENVKMKQEWQDLISDILGVKPVYINSKLVSGQLRARLYWTNIDGVTVPEDKGILLKYIIENGYVDRDKSYCIDHNYWKGGNPKNYFEKSRRQLVFTNNTMQEYRKLTPLECERLQTVPEGYTEGVSNTARYMALGNGWTVDVIVEFFKHLKSPENV